MVKNINCVVINWRSLPHDMLAVASSPFPTSPMASTLNGKEFEPLQHWPPAFWKFNFLEDFDNGT